MPDFSLKRRHLSAYDQRVKYFSKHPVLPGDVVLLGDSMFEIGAWEEWFPDVPVRNRGISGDHTQGLIDRLEPELGQPAKLFLMIGTNDIDYMVPEPTMFANVETILTSVRRQSPDVRMYVQTVLPRTLELAQRIQSVNDGYRALADRLHVGFVDLFGLFADERGVMRTEFSEDQFHLVPSGYLVWREAVGPLITGA